MSVVKGSWSPLVIFFMWVYNRKEKTKTLTKIKNLVQCGYYSSTMYIIMEKEILFPKLILTQWKIKFTLWKEIKVRKKIP